MDIVPSKRPWVLMTAEASFGRMDRVKKMGEHFDVIIVPAAYFDQMLEIIHEQAAEDGNQDVQSPRGSNYPGPR